MGQSLDFVLLPLTWAFSTFARLLTASGYMPLYFAIFFIGVVMRLIVRPIIGAAQRDERQKQNRNKRRDSGSKNRNSPKGD